MKKIVMVLVLMLYTIFFSSCNKKSDSIVDNNNSQNNTKEWIKVNNGLTTEFVFSLATKGSYIFAGTDDGLFISSDNGISWSKNSVGLPDGAQITSIVVSGDKMFAGVFGFGYSRCGVFISNDNGSNWRAVNSGLTDSLVVTLAISGSNLFAGTLGGGIFLSTNNGAKWSAINKGLNNLSIQSIIGNGNIIFAATNFGVFRSTNNGTNWTIINPAFAFPSSSIFPTRLIVSGSTLFAGIYKKDSDYGGYIFVSNNNGASWDSVESGWSGDQISAFAVYDKYLIAGTVRGVFLSSNNGSSWGEINSGLQVNTVNALAVTDNYIYAAIQGNGVWRKNLNK